MRSEDFAWRVPGSRIAFLIGVVGIFLLTHWPKLAIPLPGRPDLVAHLVIFGTWTILCTACGFFGPWHSARNIGKSVAVSVAYSAFDEALQAIPFIQRQAAWDDWCADVVGVAVGGLVMLAAAWWYQRKIRASV